MGSEMCIRDSHYPDPALRRRGDTDILVSEENFIRAKTVLTELGFITGRVPSGKYSTVASHYIFTDDMDLEHHVDIQKTINSCPLISRPFSYSLLRPITKTVNMTGHAIETLPDEYAIILASFHHNVSVKKYHHQKLSTPSEAYDLIWLYDIYLLAKNFEAKNWQSVIKISCEMGLAGSSYSALLLAQNLLGANVPNSALAQLEAEGRSSKIDKYLRAGLAKELGMKILGQKGIINSLGYCLECILPNRAYMRQRYNYVRPQWLPFLYARRLVDGSLLLANIRQKN